MTTETAAPDAESTSHQIPTGTILSMGFIGLLLTQFFGAFLDNFYRWFAVSVVQEQLDAVQTITLGSISLLFPFLLFTPTAGWLADRFPKKNVIVGCKLLEFPITVLAVLALLWGNVWLMLSVVVMLGTQSALFGSSKFGSLAESLPPEQLARANGLMQLVSMSAIILGGIAGYGTCEYVRPDNAMLREAVLASSKAAAENIPFTMPPAHQVSTFELVFVGGIMLIVAAIGTIGSLCVDFRPAADPHRPTEINPIPNFVKAIGSLLEDRHLWLTALGISFFFGLGALSQANLDQFGPLTYGITKTETGILLAALTLGVGVGCALAGYMSAGQIELGITPVGGIGIVISATLVWMTGLFSDPALHSHQWCYYLGIGSLFLLGISAGMFDVPLEAYLQHRADPRKRGTVLGGAYFLMFTMAIVAVVIYNVLGMLKLSPRAVFLFIAVTTIPIVIAVFRIIPRQALRFMMRMWCNVVYRVRITGEKNVPQEGGALIVANHITFIDGVMMQAMIPRMSRFIVYADFTEMKGLSFLAKIMQIIPIRATDGPKAILKALQTAKEAVQAGEVVVIFAEGGLTRTGQLQPFARGMLKIVEGTGAPIIPAYLHGLWGSLFSFYGGTFFWKWPRRWPYPVGVRFGEPMHNVKEAGEVRRAVETLGVEEMDITAKQELIPARKFIRNCKRTLRVERVVDSAGTKLTGGALLTASLAMRRVLLRETIKPGEKNIGVLLPPSAGGCIANMALALAGKTAVNLNYTLSDDVLNICIKKAGITHVLTSKKFVEKKPFAIEGAEFVYLEDLKEKITGWDKGVCAAQAYACPASMLEWSLGLTGIGLNETLTIVFTSGSTGEPKGVVLSHGNVGSNIDAVDQLLQLEQKDAILGILPFFHSFGYTACMWLPMCYAVRGVYHFNPLDARIVGRLVQENKVTILMATPTFLKMYIKRCEKEQFATLDIVVVGAEKMPVDLAKEFQEKFGIIPSEGYGTTELSPVAAVNIPDHRSGKLVQQGTKLGTVGRPLPGVLAKVINPDTGEDLGFNKEGLLLIKGPNVMQGYLNEPKKTAEVMRDGWYITGDFASIEPDGFVTITGRQSRFSKIGGEMVPHIRIEEELTRFSFAPGEEDDGMTRLAVSAVPDESRGEKLIVLHRKLNVTPDEMIKKLAETGAPKLWLPSSNCFFEVEEIPMLGTGKLDLKALKEMALDKTSAKS